MGCAFLVQAAQFNAEMSAHHKSPGIQLTGPRPSLRVEGRSVIGVSALEGVGESDACRPMDGTVSASRDRLVD